MKRTRQKRAAVQVVDHRVAVVCWFGLAMGAVAFLFTVSLVAKHMSASDVHIATFMLLLPLLFVGMFHRRIAWYAEIAEAEVRVYSWVGLRRAKPHTVVRSSAATEELRALADACRDRLSKDAALLDPFDRRRWVRSARSSFVESLLAWVEKELRQRDGPRSTDD